MSAALLPEIRYRAIDGDGEVIPLALMYTWAAGTSTPLATYSDSDLTIANAIPLEADSGGLFGPMYLAATGYKIGLYPANPAPPVVPTDTPYYTQDNVLDPGAYFAANFGTAMQVGSRNVTSGYTLLSTDRLVTVASSGATIFNLLAASTFTSDVTIKNMLGGTVVITPNGSDTVDTNSTWTLEAAVDPVFPAVTLRPVTGGWLIVSSHRAA